MLDNLISLIMIITPLIIGFFIPISSTALSWVTWSLGKIVFVILFFIGLSLSQIQNFGAQLGFILSHVAVLMACCIGVSSLALMFFDKLHPWQRQLPHSHNDNKVDLLATFIQLGCVVLGFIVGKWLFGKIAPADLPISIGTFVKGLLMLLVLLVGLQLSHAGMTLREVLLNKRGVQMSVVFCLSVAVGGIVFGLIMPDATVIQGLALSSGYGWYSLSGIVMTDAYGAVWGSVALLNDLLREFLSFLLIPLLMRRFPCTAVGLGGVTSMDFTLPVIQSSGGNEVVPLAMSFGFIVNIVSPVLMVVFSSFG